MKARFRGLTSEGVHGRGNVKKKRTGHERDERRDCTIRVSVPTRKPPDPDLDHIHHRQHQKDATHDGPSGRAHHPKPQDLQIDVGSKGLVHILAVEQIDGQLQALCDQAREEEEAEGDDLENQQPLRHIWARVAFVHQALLAWRGEGEADEDGDGEEGVDVDEAVEGDNVDAGGGPPGVGAGAVVWILCVGSRSGEGERKRENLREGFD